MTGAAHLVSQQVDDLPSILSAVSATVGAIGAVCAAYITTRNGKRHDTKLAAIDKAVNGAAPNESTLRETVEQIAEHTVPPGL